MSDPSFSPSKCSRRARHGRTGMRKRRLYQRFKVAEYWIVDVDARLVERWRPADARPEILADVLEWQPDRACPPLLIDLSTYFAEVLEE